MSGPSRSAPPSSVSSADFDAEVTRATAAEQANAAAIAANSAAIAAARGEVYYGGGSVPARPTLGFTHYDWYGTADPSANMAEGDGWIQL